MAWAAIDPEGPYLAAGCSRSEYTLCEQVPGMNFRKSDGLWRVPLSWPAWVAFLTLWQYQPVSIHPQLQAWAHQEWVRVQHAYELRSALDATDPDVIAAIGQFGASAESKLRPPQRAGVQWLTEMRRCILEDPMGNGKTPQLIRAVEVTGKGPWLVVATGAALYSWERELGRWAPELSVRVLDGTANRRRKAIMDEGEADVYVIAWPVLRYHTRLAAYPGHTFVKCDNHGGSMGKTRAQCEMCEKELNDIRWAGVIADEAHRMQNAKSKWTRAVWYLAHQAEYFWAVTGTPVGDTIEDLWAICHGIDPRGFPAKSRYLDLFAVKQHNWHGGSEFLGLKPETEAAFHAITQPLMRRVPKEIMRPDMAPRLETEFRYPEMAPAQSRAYKQVRKEALAELESTTVVTGGALAAFGRLCQLAVASIETSDGEDKDGFTRQVVTMALPSSKADDLLEFLEDNPGQLAVSVNSPQLMKLCEAKLALAKITHCAITGEQSPRQRDQSVQWFQDGDCRVIFISAGAGGESITLTASNTILFLQPNPSLFKTEQLIGRLDRIGQQYPVRVVYSISQGTVEERLYELSQEKVDRADQVTRDADLLRWMIGSDTSVAPQK